MAMDPEGDSNLMFEYVPSTIIVPAYEDVKNYKTPEEMIARLGQLHSPKDRLRDLFVSLFKFGPKDDVTHEASWIRSMALQGCFAGVAYGVILNNKAAHTEYQRKHNAQVFEGTYRADRHYWDTLIHRCIARGSRYGIKVGLLTGTAGFISFGSITYRNQLYLPDWIVGFTTLGGLSRMWLGSKAVAVGSLFGFVAGLIGYGAARCIELSTGQSVTHFRTMNHLLWQETQEAKLMRNMEQHSKDHMNLIDQIVRGVK